MLFWFSLFTVSLFLLIWISSFCLVARLSGWTKLSSAYPSPGVNKASRRLLFESLGLHWWAAYNGCIQASFDDSGCQLWLLPLCRFGHRPILIPWDDIEVLESRGYTGSSYTMVLRKFSSWKMRISERLGGTLQEELADRKAFSDSAQERT